MRSSRLAGFLLAAFTAAATGLLAPAALAQAPQPTKRIDVERFYKGRWYELGRRPMWITDGCVAGATDYGRGSRGEITVLDSCREGNPNGPWKTIGGPGTILDPGVNAKLRVDYTLYGVIPIQRDYWVIDRAPNYAWFISADPTFKDLYIYTRSPRISPAQLRQLVGRARALGYDVRQLEFPTPATR